MATKMFKSGVMQPEMQLSVQIRCWYYNNNNTIINNNKVSMIIHALQKGEWKSEWLA